MRRIVIMLIFIMLVPNIISAVESEEAVIYVSSAGNDSNIGTMDKPLKTLGAARMKARSIKQKVRVVFREGIYRLNDTENFSYKDGRLAWTPVSYEAAKGERVVFSGAMQLDTSKFKEITDENILARLPDVSRGRVMQLDLNEQGITSEMIGDIDFSDFYLNLSNPYVNLYLNGREQELSQWPNGEHNYSVFNAVIHSNASTDGHGPIFQYTGARPERWTLAKDWYIDGFLNYDWQYLMIKGKSVNTKDQTIIFDANNFGISSSGSKRWKALNLLEEIDMPSEWYIDKNTRILYYYPQKELSKADMLEISILKKPMLKFTSSSTETSKEPMNTTFSGIEFAMTRDNAVQFYQASGVSFDDCTFTNCSRYGIYGTGDGIVIHNSRFTHIDGFAIKIADGGDYSQAAKPSYIKNNYFSDCAEKSGPAPQMVVSDARNLHFINNTLHNSGGAAILYGGNSGTETVIKYNELYNLMKTRNDIGAIYGPFGRTAQKNEIAYNFIYDYLAQDKYVAKGHIYTEGIYMDDTSSGSYIHHNIMAYGGGGIQIGGGQNMVINNNIIFGCADKPMLTDNRGETWTGTQDRIISESPVYTKRLMLSREAQRIPELVKSLTDPYPPLNNKITDNTSDSKFEVNNRIKELGLVENNIKAEISDFVDPDNYDFRIKSDSIAAKRCPDTLTEANFDINSVGVDDSVCDILKTNREFKLIFPEDNRKEIVSRDLTLFWEKANIADKYKVTIAKNPEMTEVVEEIMAPYNYAEPKNLKSGGITYYWTVEAINTGVKTKDHWGTDKVFKFTTTQYDAIDKNTLGVNIKRAEGMYTSIDANEYEKAAVENLKNTISEAKAAKSLKPGSITYDETDILIAKLEKAKSDLEASRIINSVPMPAGLINDPDNWGPDDKAAVVRDGAITFTKNNSPNVYMKKLPSLNDLHKFEAKVSFEGSWMGLILRQKDTSKAIWLDSGYLVVIKPDVFELQKFPGGVIETKENKAVGENEWNTFEYGVVNGIESNRVIFKVNGESVFDWKDYDRYTSGENGYFTIYLPSGEVSVRGYGAD